MEYVGRESSGYVDMEKAIHIHKITNTFKVCIVTEKQTCLRCRCLEMSGLQLAYIIVH